MSTGAVTRPHPSDDGDGTTTRPAATGDGTTTRPAATGDAADPAGAGTTTRPAATDDGTTSRPAATGDGTTTRPAATGDAADPAGAGTTTRPAATDDGTTSRPATTGEAADPAGAGTTTRPAATGNGTTSRPAATGDAADPAGAGTTTRPAAGDAADPDGAVTRRVSGIKSTGAGVVTPPHGAHDSSEPKSAAPSPAARPGCWPVLTNVRVFTALAASLVLLRAAAARYNLHLSGHVQRRYGLREQEIDFLFGVEKIGFALTCLLAGYYGNKMRKPLAVMAGALLCACGMVVMASAYFRSGPLKIETNNPISGTQRLQ